MPTMVLQVGRPARNVVYLPLKWARRPRDPAPFLDWFGDAVAGALILTVGAAVRIFGI
jgi:hypothetical protein